MFSNKNYENVLDIVLCGEIKGVRLDHIVYQVLKNMHISDLLAKRSNVICVD